MGLNPSLRNESSATDCCLYFSDRPEQPNAIWLEDVGALYRDAMLPPTI